MLTWQHFLFGQANFLDKKINLHFTKTRLEEVLTEISNQTGARFSYSNSDLDLDDKITLKENQISLEKALNKIFEARHIKWSLTNGIIALKAKCHPSFRLCIRLKDSILQIPIPYAAILVVEIDRAQQTDYNGNYCFTDLCQKNLTLYIQAFGYKARKLSCSISGENYQLTVSLAPDKTNLKEVVVTSDNIIENTSTSAIQLTNTQIENADGMSNDPMNALTLLPGINAKADLFGPNEISVRGGETDENLFLLDNIPLPFPSHFFGQSVINPEMIEKVEILTGGFTPNYGNAMSSVFNFSTKTGDLEHYRGGLNFNFLNSSAIAQGPIVKDRLSLIVGFRLSNLGLLGKAFGMKLNMSDLNSKITYIINNNNCLHFTFLKVNDRIYFPFEEFFDPLARFNVRNSIAAGSLQWQCTWNRKIYSKLSLLRSGMNFKQDITGSLQLLSNSTYSLREDISIYPTSKSKLKTGCELNYKDDQWQMSSFYKATDIDTGDSSKLMQNEYFKKKNPYGAVYFFYEGSPLPRLFFNLGGRLDYNCLNRKYDISPRLALTYPVGAKIILSGNCGYFYQAPNTNQIVQNYHLKSSKLTQYVLSFKTKISQQIIAKVEGYYKNYRNVIVFDTLFRYNNSGYGYAKGLEFSVFKELGVLTGWASYAYSFANRKRNMQDRIYPAYNDQRHVLNFQFNIRIQDYSSKRIPFFPDFLSIQFKYASGYPYTPATGTYFTGTKYQLLLGDVNSKRNQGYTNLNAKIEWNQKLGKRRRNEIKYYLDFWNILGSKNSLSREYFVDDQGQLDVVDNFAFGFFISFGVKLNFN